MVCRGKMVKAQQCGNTLGAVNLMELGYMTNLPEAVGFVYLLTDGEFQKIGYTSNIDSRLSALQTGNARPITVLASFPSAFPAKDEKAIHLKMKPYRVNREWFSIPPAKLNRIGEWFTPSVDAFLSVTQSDHRSPLGIDELIASFNGMWSGNHSHHGATGIMSQMSDMARERIDPDYGYEQTLKRTHAAYMRQGLSDVEATAALQRLIEQHESTEY
jgi:hypothetical protein